MNDLLDNLESFNLIKYTGHYVFTIDEGMGRPIVFQGEDLDAILREVEQYHEVKRKARADRKRKYGF